VGEPCIIFISADVFLNDTILCEKNYCEYYKYKVWEVEALVCIINYRFMQVTQLPKENNKYADLMPKIYVVEKLLVKIQIRKTLRYFSI
jgi:hypothetical protein